MYKKYIKKIKKSSENDNYYRPHYLILYRMAPKFIILTTTGHDNSENGKTHMTDYIEKQLNSKHSFVLLMGEWKLSWIMRKKHVNIISDPKIAQDILNYKNEYIMKKRFHKYMFETSLGTLQDYEYNGKHVGIQKEFNINDKKSNMLMVLKYNGNKIFDIEYKTIFWTSVSHRDISQHLTIKETNIYIDLLVGNVDFVKYELIPNEANVPIYDPTYPMPEFHYDSHAYDKWDPTQQKNKVYYLTV